MPFSSCPRGSRPTTSRRPCGPMSACASWKIHRVSTYGDRSPTPIRRCRPASSSTTSTPPRRWGGGTWPRSSTAPWRTPSGSRPHSRRPADTSWATSWYSPPPWANGHSTSRDLPNQLTAAHLQTALCGSGFRIRITRAWRPSLRSTWTDSRQSSPTAGRTMPPRRSRPLVGCPTRS